MNIIWIHNFTHHPILTKKPEWIFCSQIIHLFMVKRHTPGSSTVVSHTEVGWCPISMCWINSRREITTCHDGADQSEEEKFWQNGTKRIEGISIEISRICMFFSFSHFSLVHNHRSWHYNFFVLEGTMSNDSVGTLMTEPPVLGRPGQNLGLCCWCSSSPLAGQSSALLKWQLHRFA